MPNTNTRVWLLLLVDACSATCSGTLVLSTVVIVVDPLAVGDTRPDDVDTLDVSDKVDSVWEVSWLLGPLAVVMSACADISVDVSRSAAVGVSAWVDISVVVSWSADVVVSAWVDISVVVSWSADVVVSASVDKYVVVSWSAKVVVSACVDISVVVSWSAVVVSA